MDRLGTSHRYICSIPNILASGCICALSPGDTSIQAPSFLNWKLTLNCWWKCSSDSFFRIRSWAKMQRTRFEHHLGRRFHTLSLLDWKFVDVTLAHSGHPIWLGSFTQLIWLSPSKCVALGKESKMLTSRQGGAMSIDYWSQQLFSILSLSAWWNLEANLCTTRWLYVIQLIFLNWASSMKTELF